MPEIKDSDFLRQRAHDLLKFPDFLTQARKAVAGVFPSNHSGLCDDRDKSYFLNDRVASFVFVLRFLMDNFPSWSEFSPKFDDHVSYFKELSDPRLKLQIIKHWGDLIEAMLDDIRDLGINFESISPQS